MIKKEAQTKSLALTANTEFWGECEFKVLLGNWCKDFNYETLKEINYEVMPSPYNLKEQTSLYYHINECYERVVSQISLILNKSNNVNLDIRSWKIILGPWLLYYLSAVYDRVAHVNHFIDIYGNNVEVTTLDIDSFISYKNTYDSVMALKDDRYNLQIFSAILNYKSINSKKKIWTKATTKPNLSLKFNVHIRNLVTTLMCKLSKFGFLKRAIFRSSYLPKVLELKLNFHFFGSLFHSFNVEESSNNVKANYQYRKAIFLEWLPVNDFEKIIQHLIVYDLPLCFLENWEFTVKESKKYYPNDIKTIFSANSWYFDEQFKYWAANCARKGSLLIGNQHGGGYGSYITIAEYHELSILDKYYTWGWKTKSNTFPMPASKLINNKTHKRLKINKILWAGTLVNRYLIEFPFLSTFSSEYIEWQIRFYNELEGEVRSLITFRPHYESYIRGYVEKISELTKDLKIESWSVPFQTSIQESKLFICDHNSTTFLEALSANVPTILFWNPDHYEVFDHAKPYYESLIANDILFDSPENAAKFISKVYHNVEDWWNEPQRQEVIKSFCEKFAKKETNGIQIWNSQLNCIL